MSRPAMAPLSHAEDRARWQEYAHARERLAAEADTRGDHETAAANRRLAKLYREEADEACPYPAEGTVTFYKPQAVGKSETPYWATCPTPYLGRRSIGARGYHATGNKRSRRRRAARERARNGCVLGAPVCKSARACFCAFIFQ